MDNKKLTDLQIACKPIVNSESSSKDSVSRVSDVEALELMSQVVTFADGGLASLQNYASTLDGLRHSLPFSSSAPTSERSNSDAQARTANAHCGDPEEAP